MWWAFGAVSLVAALFVVVATLRQQPLGDVAPKTLREMGLVMLVVTALFALVWYLGVDPGVVN